MKRKKLILAMLIYNIMHDNLEEMLMVWNMKRGAEFFKRTYEFFQFADLSGNFKKFRFYSSMDGIREHYAK